MYAHIILFITHICIHFFVKDKYPRVSIVFHITLFFSLGIGAILTNSDVYYGSPFFIIAILFSSTFLEKRYAFATLIISVISGYLISYLILDSVRHIMIMGPAIIGYVVVNIFSELKNKLEKLVRNTNSANSKLQNQIEQKKNFYATMTHELRTLLNGIIGAVEAIKLTKVSNYQEEMLKIVSFSSKALLDIVNDILDFSKFGTDIFKLNKEFFYLSDCLQNVVEAHKIAAQSKGLEIKTNFPLKEGKFINTDLVRLTQVLNNLISNAIIFTESGSISLSFNFESVDDIEKIFFKVQDTGIGISEEYLKNIFTSFTQESNRTSKLYGGTGLGLSICKELVTLMGGEIEVSSKIDEGSCFSFYIEVDNTVPLPQRNPLTKELSFNKLDLKQPEELRVLVAEDNYINIKIMNNTLNSLGITASYSHNGLEVIEKLKSNNYHIIFMDIKMPLMDGIETTKFIRKNYQNIFIIACSANLKDGDDVSELQMDASIGKPISRDSVERVISQYLSLKNSKAS